MPSIYEMMVGANNATQQGYERGQQSKLARLYSDALQAPEQRQDALVQMARISPDAANGASGHFDKMDDNARKRLGQYAAAFSALPDDQKAQAYPQLLQQAQAAGLPVPAGEYQPQYAKGIAQIAQAFRGGTSNDGTPSDIRSLQMLQANPELMALDRERRQAGGMVPKLVKTANGYAWGTPGGALAPAYEGVAQPQGVPGTTQDQVDAVTQTASWMAENGVPDDKITAWIQGQPGFGAAPAPSAAEPPRAQPYVAPPKPPTQIQLNADQRDQERLRLAQETAASTAQLKQQASDDKRQAAQRRQQASADSANQLVSAIDTLTKSGGFGNLGTVTGDIAANIPFRRNDTKDADAQLKNIAGQVALSTMNQLKTLSAAGATGFGALSAPELKLLNNSIATLQSEDISHAQLVASLKTIRDKMAKIANWQPGQGSAQGGGWSIEAAD